MKEKPLISVGEARKILGKEAREFTDEQVMAIITLLTDSARAFIRKRRVRKK